MINKENYPKEDKKKSLYNKKIDSIIFPKTDKSYLADIEELIRKFRGSSQEILRIPRNPSDKPASEKRKEKFSPEERKRILAPFNEVFFPDALMDDLIVRTSVPQLLDVQSPLYPGVILFGPPGTGKSEFQRALRKSYELAGAYAKDVSAAALNTMWVGQYAKNLEEELQTAATQGKATGLPALLCFDEGSILAQKAASGSTSVSKHYQEAIDTLKRYLGNDAGKWLVLGISTNLLPEEFEDAMTREGRLTTFYVGMPQEREISRMWTHFLKRFKTLDVGEEQAAELAGIFPEATGAFVYKFCETYNATRRQQILAGKGFPRLLDALGSGVNVTDEEVKSSTNYETFRKDLAGSVEQFRKRQNNGNENSLQIGFHAMKRQDED